MPSLRTVSSVLAMIGSAAGILALGWNVTSAISHSVNSYLQISIKVEKANSKIASVLAEIENKSGENKSIRYAAIMVFPAREHGNEAIEKLGECAKTTVSETQPHFLKHWPQETVACEDKSHLLIPIPYFYNEQTYIGDEKIATRLPIELGNLSSVESVYTVRLILIDQENSWLGSKTSLRSSQDLLFASDKQLESSRSLARTNSSTRTVHRSAVPRGGQSVRKE